MAEADHRWVHVACYHPNGDTVRFDLSGVLTFLVGANSMGDNPGCMPSSNGFSYARSEDGIPLVAGSLADLVVETPDLLQHIAVQTWEH